MTSTKQTFTAGPWLVSAEKADLMVMGFDQRQQCEAPVAFIPNDLPSQEANARLIAAAPELYEMVKALQEALNETSNIVREVCNTRDHRVELALVSKFDALDDRALELMIRVEGKE